MCKMMSLVTIRAGSLCELAILSSSEFHVLEKHYPISKLDVPVSLHNVDNWFIVGLQLRTNLRTQFVESSVHSQEENMPTSLIEGGAVIEGILSEGEAERYM